MEIFKRYAFEILAVAAIAVSVVVIVSGPRAHADIINPHPVPPSNSVTNGMLKDGIVTDSKVSSSAHIDLGKIGTSTDDKKVVYGTGGALGTSSNLTYNSSSNELTVVGGKISATSTNFNGQDITFPSTQGGSGDVLTNQGGNVLAWQTAASNGIANSFTVSSDVNTGDIVSLATTTATSTIVSVSQTQNDALGIGNVSGRNCVAQDYSTTTETVLNGITISVKKTGTPSDNLVFGIHADNSLDPSSTYLASTTVSGSSISTAQQNRSYLFDKAPRLSANTTYWFTMCRTGAIDASNYYNIGLDSGNPYSGGNAYTCNSSFVCSAITPTEDVTSSLNLITSMGDVFPSSSVVPVISSGIVGVVTATTSEGVSVSVTTAGSSTLYGTILGSIYYLGDSVGSASTTAGSIVRTLGLSYSDNSLFFEPWKL